MQSYLRLSILLIRICLHQGSFHDHRQDRDGEFLVRFDSQKRGTESHTDTADKFANLLLEVLRPSGTKAFDALQSDLNNLFDEALIRLDSGCGLCFSFVAFILSLGSGTISAGKLHATLARLPQVDHEDITNVLYRYAKNYGSTFGVLRAVRNAILMDYRLGEPECVELANLIALFAREAASVDTFDELIAPHPLRFESDYRPRDRISGEVLDEDMSDVQYYISLMKHNAEALSSALLFGITDVADMLGLEPDEVDEENLRESVERLSTLDDRIIAEELLLTINSVRHNVQVIKFNQGLEAYSKEGACSDALLLHHEIVGEQSLFSKSLFLFLKQNYFNGYNVYNSLLNGLILSELGIESGLLSLESLLNTHPEIFVGSEVYVQSDATSPVMLPTTTPGCELKEPFVTLENSDGLASCLDICVADSRCAYADFRDTVCSLYSSCEVKEGSSTRLVYAKKSFPRQHPCWPPTAGCIVWIHQQLASLHSRVESLNWLTRYYDRLGDPRTAVEWASRSAELGDSEGVFFLGYLHLKAWDEHPIDTELAKSFFHSLLTDFEVGIFPVSLESDEQLGNADEIEFESAKVIAEQLGIHDIPSRHTEARRHKSIVNWFAGVYGLLLVAFTQNAYLLSRVCTVLALVPVLLMLITRRTYIV